MSEIINGIVRIPKQLSTTKPTVVPLHHATKHEEGYPKQRKQLGGTLEMAQGLIFENMAVVLSESQHFPKHLLWQVCFQLFLLKLGIKSLNLRSFVSDCVTLGKSLSIFEPLFPHLLK